MISYLPNVQAIIAAELNEARLGLAKIKLCVGNRLFLINLSIYPGCRSGTIACPFVTSGRCLLHL